LQSVQDAATIFICVTQASHTIGIAAFVDFIYVQTNNPHNKGCRTGREDSTAI
jgi:hypothetical protein